MRENEIGPGTLSVLNVGAGDLKFRFDKDDPDEVTQAKRVIEDMLRRGYSLLVEHNGELRRATGFDATKGCYVVTEPPPAVPEPTAAPEASLKAPGAAAAASPTQTTPLPDLFPGTPRRRGRPPGKRREIPMGQAHATGVAPTAGG